MRNNNIYKPSNIISAVCQKLMLVHRDAFYTKMFERQENKRIKDSNCIRTICDLLSKLKRELKYLTNKHPDLKNLIVIKFSLKIIEHSLLKDTRKK